MAKRADNIFVRAKAYRDLHPRISFQDAIQRVKGGRAIKGTKPARVVKAKVTGTRKRKVVVEKIYSTNPGRRLAINVGIVARGQKIINEIERLERERAKHSDKTTKDFFALAINKEHEKLRNLSTKF
jgi:hypothetical protein